MLMKVKLITRKILLRNFRSLKYRLVSETGPTSAVAVSVYPDEETAKNATVARNARMENCTQEEKRCDVSKRGDSISGLTASSLPNQSRSVALYA